MADDLIVASGTTLALNDAPTDKLQNAFQRIPVETFKDLVTAGYISNDESLKRLLGSAKEATKFALSNKSVQRVRIEGTTRLDLGRFSNFSLAATKTTAREQSSFWNVFRDIDPHVAASIDTNARISDYIANFNKVIVSYLFNNITIEPNAVLEIRNPTNTLRCNELLIRRAGRLVLKKSGVHIRAFSIQGEQ
ncbi:hypothetical protein [Paenibacillus silvisoli]|uniref:hypothetical protein n=1 Tax=Paenibacillus silvisoli TaxID=3110539 RepID=UPI0028056A48|nr:hypothetical protein [Paenibacillus silvisoli]